MGFTREDLNPTNLRLGSSAEGSSGSSAEEGQREKTGSHVIWGCTSGRRCPSACATQRPLSKTDGSRFDRSDEKDGNFVMCYVDDVVIATPTLEDHIGSKRSLTE